MLLAQIFAITIFIIMFFLVIVELIERHYTTLICGFLTLVLVFGVGLHSWSAIVETLNFKSIFMLDFWWSKSSHESSTGINWATIIFIAGMMIMVEGMARVGFFRWLCMLLAKAVKYKVLPIFMAFMLMSSFLAMFIDSITVILFLAVVTVELSQLLKFNPVYMIMAEVFCANLGGSATMCGDPPNIIIGTALNYSFFDFLLNTGLTALISLVFIVIYFYFVCKKKYKDAGKDVDISTLPTPKSAITDKRGFIISSIIFFISVLLLVTHSITGLSVAFIGALSAILTIITSLKHIKEIMKRVDYKTLLFFIGLFIVVSGLEQTGILEFIAGFIQKISGGNMYVMIGIIIWISAIASAFIDNIPFAATMIPVIQSLTVSSGLPLTTLAWSLVVGTDIGGSATPIGASANVVGISVASKAGHLISWGKYCKFCVPATLIVMLISTIVIFLRYL